LGWFGWGRAGGCESGESNCIAIVMMLAMCAGVKARAAHRVLTAGRGMPENALDELQTTQAQRLGASVAMIRVGKAHAAAVQVQRPVLGQRAALEVARQVPCIGSGLCKPST